ncbi:MAG TPA: hypothetical protein VFV72_02570 [Candidatus Limnocylindrales bacterium]|nr:hypothetical protein [Candidatus Limnocylindrales bacterium]
MPVTTDTPTNIVAGAGEVYKNQDSFGASRDANVFRIERELITPEINGLKGMLKGTDYIRRSEGILETTILEVSAASLPSTWPGSSSDTAGDTTTIDEDNTRRIPTSAYADWELQLERLGGGEFQFEVDDAIHVGNFESEFTDDGFFGTRLELHSRWDPANLTASPHRIRILTTAS